MSGFTRRHLMGRGLMSAGALAAPGTLALAEIANAQDDDQADELERLVDLEQAAELAFSIAAEEGDVDADAVALLEELSIHAKDHATAFSEAMEQLLADPPEKSSDPEDYESLADFDPAADGKELIAFLIGLEEELIAAYEEDEPALEAPDLVRTAAQVAASHAQALVALRLAAGDSEPFSTELPPRSTSATDSEEEDTES